MSLLVSQLGLRIELEVLACKQLFIFMGHHSDDRMLSRMFSWVAFKDLRMTPRMIHRFPLGFVG